MVKARNTCVADATGSPGPVKELQLDDLEFDNDLQLRTCIDQDHVDTLVDAYTLAEETNSPLMPPPVRVLFDGKRHWVWDGFHRILARKRAGFGSVRCYVEKGTKRDAILKAAGANYNHGLPRSNEDKRLAVRALLNDRTWGKRSDRWIAETCHVSRPLVAECRANLQALAAALAAADAEPSEQSQVAELPPAEEGRVGRDGKTYPAANQDRDRGHGANAVSLAQDAVQDDDDVAEPDAQIVERTALFCRLQDLYRDHIRGKVKLNRPQVELLQAILDGRLMIEGQIKDQALQTLEMHRGPATIAPYLTCDEPTDEDPGDNALPLGQNAAAEFRRRLVAWCQTQLRNIDDLDWQVIADVFLDVGSECKTW